MALTEKELQQLTKCIAPTTSIMASGIGRLFLSSPNPRANRKDPSSIFGSFPYLANDVWSDTLVQGAVLLVIDRVQDAVLLQIWDLDGFQRRFEYELYYDLEYLSLDPNFHAFEMEDCVAGLCFSNKDVAKKFATKVRALRPDSAQMAGAAQQKKRGLFGGVVGQDKMEISGVINVVHQQHVGMKNDGTFDMNALSPEWRQFFKAAGVKKSDLKNPETARAVMQSIQVSGFSLAATPGKYVQASHVPPVVAPRPTVANTTVKKEAAPKPEPQYTKKELEKHYSVEQVEALERYKRELEDFERAKKQYEDDLAEYERQVALETWEQDNTRFLEQHETERRTSTADKFKAPPPLPPRRDKKQESSSNVLAGVERTVSPEPMRPAESKSKPPPPARKPSVAEPAPKPAPPPVRKTETKPAPAPEPSPKAAAAAPHLPPRPPELPPPPPPLPDMPGGFNPMKDLQKQLQAVKLSETPRPASRMFLAAIAASATQLKPVDTSAPPVKRTDATQTENLMQLLAATMAQRRVQLTSGGDSDDDWSE